MRLAAALLLVVPTLAAGEDDRLLGARGGGDYWVGGQVNVISQAHPGFGARYTGENSLRSTAEVATSLVASFHSAFSLARWTDAIVHVEMVAGRGLSQALGVGGFPNVDVVRNPQLSAEPYLARAMVRQVIPLGGGLEPADRGPLGTMAGLPDERLELRVGKMSTVDWFDGNSVGSDSHLQFMNWALVNCAAFDYAADTRGYTYGLYLEYDRPGWTARAGLMLMPKVANGIELDWDLLHARGENLEIDYRYTLLGREGVLRLLGFANHARMGRYRDAVAEPGGVPDVAATRAPGRVKLGAVVNVEQEVVPGVRAFARAGLSDGALESFAYTEVDDSLSLGVGADGSLWSRPGDRAGLALATNGLAPPHRDYLARGGLGFILGDGRLRYGRERILEAYYTARLWNGTYAAADVQVIGNPGYNRDRGPVVVGSLRVHVDI